MNKYFKIGIALVLFSPLIGELTTKIYNAILATTADGNKFSILYDLNDQFLILIIGVSLMLSADKIEKIMKRISQ